MENDIDIYEIHWWPAFIGHISLIIVSIISIYAWFNLHGLVQPSNQWRMFLIFFLPAMLLFLFLPRFINLFATPKILIFRENSIIVINPFNQKKVFAYEDISHLIVHRKNKNSFMARLFFSNDTIKVMFDPNWLPNFPKVLQTMQNKGIGQVIQREW